MTTVIYFDQEFAEKIILREKVATFRREKMCEIGETIDLIQKSETSEKYISSATCTGLLHLKLMKSGFIWYPDGDPRYKFHSMTVAEDDVLDRYANSMGFENWVSAAIYYRGRYGLPVEGYLTEFKTIPKISDFFSVPDVDMADTTD